MPDEPASPQDLFTRHLCVSAAWHSRAAWCTKQLYRLSLGPATGTNVVHALIWYCFAEFSWNTLRASGREALTYLVHHRVGGRRASRRGAKPQSDRQGHPAFTLLLLDLPSPWVAMQWRLCSKARGMFRNPDLLQVGAWSATRSWVCTIGYSVDHEGRLCYRCGLGSGIFSSRVTTGLHYDRGIKPAVAVRHDLILDIPPCSLLPTVRYA